MIPYIVAAVVIFLAQAGLSVFLLTRSDRVQSARVSDLKERLGVSESSRERVLEQLAAKGQASAGGPTKPLHPYYRDDGIVYHGDGSVTDALGRKIEFGSTAPIEEDRSQAGEEVVKRRYGHLKPFKDENLDNPENPEIQLP